MTQGYDGLPAYYGGSSDPITPNVGFSLKGMDPIVASNFVLADAAIGGGGSTVKINGTSVSNPNFNNTIPAAPASNVNVVWQVDGSGRVSAYVPIGGSGTVTSVALTAPAEFSVAGSPITTSGTLAITKATQAANTVWAGPTSGGVAQPTFRALVAADLPSGTGTVTSVAMTVPSILSVAGSPITTSGTLAVTLATQSPNLFFAGPTSGPAATPTFRAIGAGDIPSGTVTWDQIGRAAGNLTLNNAGFTTTFNQTSPINWLWANTTAATAAGSNADSPFLNLAGTYFTSGASAADTWNIQNNIATSLTSASVANVVENAASLVTLTITGGTFTAGAAGTSVTFTGLTTATWLNGQNVFLTTANATTLTFTDPTGHGTQASHAETGTVTQNNPTATLMITHSGSATVQISIPAPNTQTSKPTIVAGATTATGISIGTNASQPLSVFASGSASFLSMFNGGTQIGSLGGQITSGSVELNNIGGGPLTLSGGIPASGSVNTLVPRVSIGHDQSISWVTTGAVNVVGINMGTKIAMGGDNSPWLSWAPTAGTGNFTAVQITPSITQTGLTTSITSVTFTVGTATLTVSSATGFTAGQSFTVSGLTAPNNTQLNGTWTLTSAGGTTMTVAGAWTAHGATGDAGTATQKNSGSYTALLINPTETNLNGTTNRLLDMQVGGTSKCAFSNAGIATIYGGNTTVKQGTAPILATSIKTAQAAAQSGVSIVASTPSIGMWRISFVATITTAATSGGVLGGATGFTITYTNGNGDVVSKTTNMATALGIGAANNTSDSASGNLYCYAGSATAITYSYGYTAGTGTAMQYDLAVYAEFLG